MGHNGPVIRGTIALVLLLIALPAAAWNAAGHRLTAYIAWQKLSPEARATVTDLLRAHPDAPRWLAAASIEDVGLTCMLEASTWPDTIRNDPRFFDERQDEPTPPLPGFSDMGQRRTWHYMDLSLDGKKVLGDGELDQQIERLIRILRNPKESRSAKAYALPWLIHLVADLHQPLHVGHRNDEGGNLHMIEDPANRRLPRSNLHRWWDDLPGPPWLRGRHLVAAAEQLLERYPLRMSAGAPAQWRDESLDIARHHAYPATPRITPDFRASAEAIASQRIVQAGLRIAQLLESMTKVSRETRRE